MNASDNPILTFLRSASLVKERELNAVVSSFLFVVVLMSAYYILRPVRDAMASDWSDAEVSWLWTLNFFTVPVLFRSTALRSHDFVLNSLFLRPMAFLRRRSCHFTCWVLSPLTEH